MRLRSRLAIALFVLAAVAAEGAELDQNGTPHAWSGASGRYRVIDFAAAWCAPCWSALPKLQELADSRPDLDFVVVSVDERVEGRDRLVEGLALNLSVLWDEDHAIAKHYRPKAMPATYLLDPSGEIVHEYTGTAASDWEAFLAILDEIHPESTR